MWVIIIVTLLALLTISRADIINYEFAEWSARGRNDDLLRFVTVRLWFRRQKPTALMNESSVPI